MHMAYVSLHHTTTRRPCSHGPHKLQDPTPTELHLGVGLYGQQGPRIGKTAASAPPEEPPGEEMRCIHAVAPACESPTIAATRLSRPDAASAQGRAHDAI
mmetsp:Transcript_68120/g.99657  ORF Transcript_68120/g.99657 Transcript_68120/m.99657 type:complete len:100 (+) Transcript_68120:379-678(+)